MNNILFGEDPYQNKIFVIDWSPSIGSICIDLASIIDHAPGSSQPWLIKLYRSKIDFPEFENLFGKALMLRHLGTLSWMVYMMNDGQKESLNLDFFRRLKNDLEKELG